MKFKRKIKWFLLFAIKHMAYIDSELSVCEYFLDKIWDNKC